MFHLRNALRAMEPGKQLITTEMLKDIQWWEKFLPTYNSVSIMWMDQIKEPDTLVASDACLTGIGGLKGKQYYHLQLPQNYKEQKGMNIVYLELLAILVALRKWGQQLNGKRFALHCDNMAVVQVINNGTARDNLLQKMLRNVAYLCVVGQFEVVAHHILGMDNRVPDILSRLHLGEEYWAQFQELKQED